MAVVKGSLLATQLERVKEFWENRISKKILCIVRRKEGGKEGWGKRGFFFEAVCKSAVIWCLRLISYENCCLKKEGSKLRVGVSGYPSHWSTQHSPGQITTLWAAPLHMWAEVLFKHLKYSPSLFFLRGYLLLIFDFCPASVLSEPPGGWVWEAWASTGNQTGTFLSPLERSEWWSWLIPCSRQAPGGWWYSGAYVLDFKVRESCKILSSHSISFLKWCYCWL